MVTVLSYISFVHRLAIFLVLLSLVMGARAFAGEVEIVNVKFALAHSGAWNVSTTLRHADTGWEHYADAWRVVTGDDEVLATRVLHHPHVEEQPFTRSLADIVIPPGSVVVYVQAHDKVHGWGSSPVKVNLEDASGQRFEVIR